MPKKNQMIKGKYYRIWYSPIQTEWATHGEFQKLKKRFKRIPGYHGIHVDVFDSKYTGKIKGRYRFDAEKNEFIKLG